MWVLEFEKRGRKNFLSLEIQTQTKILKYLENNVLSLKNPRSCGKALTGNKKGYWRYRVGDYRVICEIKDREIVILVIDIDHRSTVYKK